MRAAIAGAARRVPTSTGARYEARAGCEHGRTDAAAEWNLEIGLNTWMHAHI